MSEDIINKGTELLTNEFKDVLISLNAHYPHESKICLWIFASAVCMVGIYKETKAIRLERKEN